MRSYRGPRGHLFTASLALMLLAISLSFSPQAALGSGEDCGGPDTPPARHLANSETCDGSLDEAPSYTVPELDGYYNSGYYDDLYSYDQTDGDRVVVTLSGSGCIWSEPAGTFTANSTATEDLKIRGRHTVPVSGGGSPCPDPPGSYSIRVVVTPNDRPTATATSVPIDGHPGETLTYEVSGTDPDGNLKSLGIRYGRGAAIEWKSQLVASSSWSTSFQYNLYGETEVTFFARDTFDAVSLPSPTYTVHLVGDDCGWGFDVAVENVALPFTCSAWVAPFNGDSSDSFTFTPGAGKRAKIAVAHGQEQGHMLTLTSPSGIVTTSGFQEMYGSTESGLWRVDMTSDGDSLPYIITITEVGAPAAPSLSLSGAPNTHQGDWYSLPMLATDPNGERLTYHVDWGDGSGAYWPLDGTAASGQTITALRRFLWNTTSTIVSVTVRNTEGLSTTMTYPLSIRLHNDCGLGPFYDAPSAPPFVTLASSCVGTIGHLLPEMVPNPPVDVVDIFRSPQRCSSVDCKIRATLTTEPGIQAEIGIEHLPGVFLTSSCSQDGCTSSVDAPLLSYPNNEYPRIRVRRSSGKGGYILSVQKLTLAQS